MICCALHGPLIDRTCPGCRAAAHAEAKARLARFVYAGQALIDDYGDEVDAILSVLGGGVWLVTDDTLMRDVGDASAWQRVAAALGVAVAGDDGLIAVARRLRAARGRR